MYLLTSEPTLSAQACTPLTRFRMVRDMVELTKRASFVGLTIQNSASTLVVVPLANSFRLVRWALFQVSRVPDDGFCGLVMPCFGVMRNEAMVLPLEPE